MGKLLAYYSEHKYQTDLVLSVLLAIALVLHYFSIFGSKDTSILILFTCAGVLPIFVSATTSIFKKEWASMDMLASIALIFSIVSKQWSSAVFIALMLSLARILQDVTEKRTKKSINSLLKLRPEKAKVELNGSLRDVALLDIRVNDIVIVDTGEYIPIDGVVVSGTASINESSLTGESVPVEKGVGDKVSSGTLVDGGSIRIQTQLVGKDTTLEKIISLIEQAEDEKPSVQTLGEKFGAYYLSAVFIGSFLLFLFTHNLLLVLSVVLVVCADDIAIAIPLAYLRAIGTAAKKGVIIKGGKHLETLGKVDVVVFDKTGTLTTGKLQVTSLSTVEGGDKAELLHLGAVISRRSNHPHSKAILDYAKTKGEGEIYPEEASVVEGKGVIGKIHNQEIALGREMFMYERGYRFDDQLKKKAEVLQENGESVSYLAKDGVVIGFFAAGDTIKNDAKDTVAELYALGIKKVVILSGDNEKVVASVANKIGIKDFHAGLLPADKLERLKEFHKTYTVAMVGDGVNDAAALAISHVGIAMGALGSDSAIESAEIVLMHDNLSAIPRTIQLARDVHKVSIEDFCIWVATNVFGLVLVFCGIIGPTGAAAYNFISDFFPLLNSVRVKMK